MYRRIKNNILYPINYKDNKYNNMNNNKSLWLMCKKKFNVYFLWIFRDNYNILRQSTDLGFYRCSRKENNKS